MAGGGARGRPASEETKTKIRRGIARRQALGLPFGRQPTRPLREYACPNCGKTFVAVLDPRERRRFCRKSCLTNWLHSYIRRVPKDAALLRRLYWEEGMTTVEIGERYGTGHRTVIDTMENLGIPRRPAHGPRRVKYCIVEGCTEPVYKIRHRSNWSMYGRRCLNHWTEHRRHLADTYALKKRIEARPRKSKRRRRKKNRRVAGR